MIRALTCHRWRGWVWIGPVLAWLVVLLVPVGLMLEKDWDERAILPGLEQPVHGMGRIEEMEAHEEERFYRDYWEKKPVIIRAARLTDNEAFRKRLSRATLVRDFGHVQLTLSTANTHSYDKVYERLDAYVANRMGPQNLSLSALESLYQFGDNAPEIEARLLRDFARPLRWMKLVKNHALSFGVAGTGSGVPFHTHAAVFAEVFYGRKRWFLTAPDVVPDYNGSETMLYWLYNRLPHLKQKESILEGICSRGDLIYLPSFWYHSTLNIGQTVFISTFI